MRRNLGIEWRWHRYAVKKKKSDELNLNPGALEILMSVVVPWHHKSKRELLLGDRCWRIGILPHVAMCAQRGQPQTSLRSHARNYHGLPKRKWKCAALEIIDTFRSTSWPYVLLFILPEVTAANGGKAARACTDRYRKKKKKKSVTEEKSVHPTKTSLKLTHALNRHMN